ncbi:MAG: hypothetical protein ACXVBH_08520 [Flavisolibacter sp.]
MPLVIILSLTYLQFFAGFGIVHLCKLRLSLPLLFAVSILLGVAVFSIVPFLLQLAYVPLTVINIFVGLCVVAFLLNLKSTTEFIGFFKKVRASRLRVKIYELPFILLIVLMVFLSAWRCFYFPPSPRDLTSGAEVIAEYAVKEKTMINSVFSVELSTTNNQFKPPFITCLQIIYKYAGFPFGQVWLTTVFICFVIFLYHVLSKRLHKLLAGLLLVAFIANPEMYGYTVMALFDYSNAVFFCLSLYFLFESFSNGERSYLILSGILMAIATYIRSETLLLALLMLPTLLFYHWRKKSGVKRVVTDMVYFVLPSVLVYLLTIMIYINYYLPSSYTVDSLRNKHLLNFGQFFKRLTDTTGDLLLAGNAVNYYGYFTFIFVTVLTANAFLRKPWNRRSLNWLFAVFVIFVGLPFIGYLFPLYDLDNSTKRGLFKIFPLMLLFMANSRVLISVSERISRWEGTP